MKKDPLGAVGPKGLKLPEVGQQIGLHIYHSRRSAVTVTIKELRENSGNAVIVVGFPSTRIIKKPRLLEEVQLLINDDSKDWVLHANVIRVSKDQLRLDLGPFARFIDSPTKH